MDVMWHRTEKQRISKDIRLDASVRDLLTIFCWSWASFSRERHSGQMLGSCPGSAYNEIGTDYFCAPVATGLVSRLFFGGLTCYFSNAARARKKSENEFPPTCSCRVNPQRLVNGRHTYHWPSHPQQGPNRHQSTGE
jgi:hypothetical protein